MALASKYNLKGKKVFSEILSKGKMSQSDSFGIAYLPNEFPDYSCFGFVISTKISKHAVLRNRVKRALSESVRFCMAEIKTGYNIVFLAKSLSLKKSTPELMAEVRPALANAKLLKI